MTTRRLLHAAVADDRTVFSFLLLLLFAPLSQTKAQAPLTAPPCDSTIFEARSLRDNGRLGLVVLLNPSKPGEIIDSIAVNIPQGQGGFYSVSAEVEYNSGNEQINETFFLLITFPDGRKSYPVNANLPRRKTAMIDANGDSIQYNIIIDDGLPESHRTYREIGVFFFEEGRNVVELHHYAELDDLFPQFVICPDTATTDLNCMINRDGNNIIAGTQSVRIDSLTLTEFCTDLQLMQTAISSQKIFVDGDSALAEIVGRDFKYLLSVKNVSLNPAHNFTVSDTLPLILVPKFENRLPDEATLDGPNRILTWIFDAPGDSLFPGDSSAISFSVNIPEFLSPLPLPFFSGSRVSAENDIVAENDISSALVFAIEDPALRFADLALTQTIAADTIVSGDSTWIKLSIENLGPGAALNITLNDTLSETLEIVSQPPDFGVGATFFIQDDVLFWRIDTIQAGVVLEDSFLVKADSVPEPVSVRNPAFIQAESDTILTNNFAEASILVLPPPPPVYDLAHFQTATQDTVFENESYTYVLTVENLGPQPAFAVTLRDSLPENITLADTLALPDFGTGKPGVLEGNILTWQFDTLAAGTALTDAFEVIVDSLSEQVELTSRSSVTAENDTFLTNNVSQTTVVARAVPSANYDVIQSHSASTDSVESGEAYSYILIVGNLGPTTAYDVVLQDFLPENVFPAAKMPTFSGGAQLTQRGRTLFWRFDSIAVNGAFTDTLNVRVGQILVPTTLTNITLVAAENDTVSTNNATQTSVAALPLPTAPTVNYDLEHTQIASKDTVRSQEEIAYALSLQNRGPATAFNVVLQDSLPADLTVVGILPDFRGAAIVRQNGQNIFWTFDSIASQTALTDSFFVTIGDIADTTFFTNISFVQAENDTIAANDSARTTILALPPEPVRPAEYTLTHFQRASVDSVKAGDIFSYTLIVQNPGPDSSLTFTMTDTLPTQIETTGAIPFLTSRDGATLFWNMPRIAPNDSAVIAFSATVNDLPADQIIPIVNLSAVIDRGDALRAQTTIFGVGEITPQAFAVECFLDRNIFAPETEQTLGINFSLNQPRNVRLDVHDMTGSHIIQLVDQSFGAGQNRFEWNGFDKNNRPAGSGLYIITFRTDAFMDWKKFMIVR